LRNRSLVACTLAAFANTVTEWTMYIAALVYAFDRGGVAATGFASIAILVPICFAAPLGGVAAERHSPARLLCAAHVVEGAALTAAAAAASADAPLVITILLCAIAQAGITFTRPAVAVLTPALVRSARELTVANVWSSSTDSASMLVGPLAATVLLAVSGAPVALAGCAAFGVAGALLILPTARREPSMKGAANGPAIGVLATIRGSLHEVRNRPGALGVLGAIGAGYVLIGSLDLLLVGFAREDLGMGDSGPGLLSTAVGAGAVISSLVAGRLVRRRRLAPLIVIAVVVITVAVVALGTSSVVWVALILLSVIGFSRALVNLTTRMLLQRSSPPGTLAPMFGLVELLAGTGMLFGAIATQALIVVNGAATALFGLGAFFLVVLVLAVRPLRHADDGADVPIVAISLLRRLPLFQPLTPLAIEAVARSAVEASVAAGTDVVSLGDVGDHFYAVTDGTFEVMRDGVCVRTFGRGEGFGEVALLANVPRTATVTARTAGSLLSIARAPFLEAVTGCDSSNRIAWTAMREWGVALPDPQVSDD
jgi:MFS family permease